MKACQIAYYALALALAVSSSTAWSEELDDGLDEETFLFEEIPSVHGASKYEQKVTEAPSRISIVTGSEIRAYGYRTFSEVLRSLPGFSVTNDRNYAYTGVRGFGIPGDYDTRLLQLVDGHRINDNLYGSLFSDHSFPVPLNTIERIEVIRGPSSSLYGSGAFFAVVNVITKTGRDVGGWEVSAAVGSLQTTRAQMTYGNRLPNGLEVLFSGTISESDGNDHLYFPEFDDPETNNGVAEGVDSEDFHKFFTRISLGDFSIEGAFGERTKAIPTASYDTVFNARETETIDRRSYLDFKYQSLLQNGAEIVARLFYDDYTYKGDYLYDYGEPGDPYISLNKDHGVGQWWGTEFQWRRQFVRHHLIFGADYRDSLDEHQKNYDVDGVYLDSRTDSSVSAVYAQDEIRLTEDLILNLGLRHDHYSSFGNTTNPRGAVIWSPRNGSVLKFLYGKAFRAPNAYELHYDDSNLTQKSSIDLRPETTTTSEIVLEQQFRNDLRGTISVYRNKISDLIALTTDPADDLLVFSNTGDAKAHGVEVELENRWENGAVATISYSHQHAENRENGERLVNYAPDMVKANVIAPLLGEQLKVALEMQYESGRLTTSRDETDDRVLTNVSLHSGTWLEGLSISVTAYNLFDETYADPASEEHLQDAIEQDSRALQVRLDYVF